MTYEEKKSLYESIMIDIAKRVKTALNESSTLNEAYKSTKISRFMNLAKEKSNDSGILFQIFKAECQIF